MFDIPDFISGIVHLEYPESLQKENRSISNIIHGLTKLFIIEVDGDRRWIKPKDILEVKLKGNPQLRLGQLFDNKSYSHIELGNYMLGLRLKVNSLKLTDVAGVALFDIEQVGYEEEYLLRELTKDGIYYKEKNKYRVNETTIKK